MAEKDSPAKPDEKAAVRAPDEVPTVREHVERLALAPWQVTALLRRHLITPAARMSAADFDAALQVALYGRL